MPHAVRALLANLGMTLRSATQPIDESPTGKLMEGVLAAIAQFDNDVRAEKTVSDMREALSRGRWTFQARLGYQNIRRPDSVTTIEPDPKRAPLVRWAFETHATAEYKKTDVLRMVTRRGLVTRRGNPVAPQTWDKVLQSLIYAGRILLDR